MSDLYTGLNKANFKAAGFDLFLMYDWLACLSLSPPLSVTSPDQAEQVERCMRLSRRLLVVMTAVGSCGGQGVAPRLEGEGVWGLAAGILSLACAGSSFSLMPSMAGLSRFRSKPLQKQPGVT